MKTLGLNPVIESPIPMELIDRLYRAAMETGVGRGVIDLAEKVVNDKHPPLEIAYLFSETEDNEESVFTGAKHLQEYELAREFLIIGGLEANGFPGYAKWSERAGKVLGNGVILPVYMEKPSQVNTLTEAQALVPQAESMNVNGMYIVSTPFHQLRAFMTLASEIIRQDAPLNVFNHIGTEQDWTEVVAHSQGTLVAPRSELMLHEMDRIQRYTIKGDILSACDIMDYMDRREIPSLH